VLGYPVLVRPSYVLGGRGMQVVYGPSDLAEWLEREALLITLDEPVLLDKFLEGALEVDVDAVADGETVLVAAVMEHIEEAGIHSGDSTCVIPPFTLGEETVGEIRSITDRLARALGVNGLLNVQYAVRNDQIFVLEANPRASRTVPFVAKATGVPLVEHSVRLLLGEPLGALDLPERVVPTRAWAKEAVFPSERFPGAASRGPEMRSTGEVMAGADTAVEAYRRALRAAGRARRGGAILPSLQTAALS
jgi:carbamoyl-phosphate synthase large subunit